jgi:hypothetical protein
VFDRARRALQRAFPRSIGGKYTSDWLRDRIAGRRSEVGVESSELYVLKAACQPAGRIAKL